MPNTKSAIRRIRRVNKQTSVNKIRKNKYKSIIKEINFLITSKKKKEAIKLLPKLNSQLMKIAGQKPVITKFKKSISNFKTRKGSNAGVKVTLRSYKMYEFIDRLVNIALPRIKDFRGLTSKGIDNSCNYSFGIKEHIIFPEVNFDKVDKIRGLDITIVTTSKTKEGALELLKEFNFPINNKKN